MTTETKKILHVISGLGTGGAERSLYNLLKMGSKITVESRVVSLTNAGSYGKRIQDLGISVITLNIKTVTGLFTALQILKNVTEDFNPDIIQGWMYHGNLAAFLTKKYYQPHSILHWNIRHSLDNISNEKLMLRNTIKLNRKLSRNKNVNSIVYNSKTSAIQHERFGFAKKKHIIPNGFDLNNFSPNKSIRSRVRKSLDISDECFLVGHVARYHPMKNHVGFLEVGIALCEKIENLQLILIGTNVEYSNLELKRIIPEQLRCRIHLLGEKDNISEFMNSFDVLCSSSNWGEAFPNVLGEAMASATPCVSTNVGDTPNIIGLTGSIVETNNPTQLFNALESLIQLPREKLQKLGLAARKRVDKNFSIQATLNSYQELYFQNSHRL